MKKVKITYNPFVKETRIEVDGQELEENSSLRFEDKRLQEWAEEFPSKFIDEFQDKNLSVEFVGNPSDFDDLKIILSLNNDISLSSLEHVEKKYDVEYTEREVEKIFNEIQGGKVERLKDKRIKDAFEQAQNKEFSINVVATMSAGKSTLINALLHKKLMPSSQQATTATIVSITSNDSSIYAGEAYDKDGKKVDEDNNLSLSKMKEWNEDDNISEIAVSGPIPCAKGTGMRLVLMDTPGPNNARNTKHRDLTYRQLSDSENSMVLFVVNSNQQGTNDEAEFLRKVSESMQECGKRSRDRFIFVVNKLDTCDPEDEDISEFLKTANDTMEEYEINEPNIFPAAALPCLQYRTSKNQTDLKGFMEKVQNHEEYQFDKYYDYNHLPIPSKNRINAELERLSDDDKVDVYTGIVSVEEAIRLYIEKYSRTMKVLDLVNSFKGSLESIRVEESLIEEMRKNEDAKKRIDKEIDAINAKIKSGELSKNVTSSIEHNNPTEKIVEKVNKTVDDMRNVCNRILSDYNGGYKEPEDAKCKLSEINNKLLNKQSALKASIESIFKKEYQTAVRNQIKELTANVKELGINTSIDVSGLALDSISIQSLPDVDDVIDDCTEEMEVKVGTKTETRIRRGERKINLFFAPWTWGKKRYKYFEEDIEVPVFDKVKHVNMEDAIKRFSDVTHKNLTQYKKVAKSGIKESVDRLIISVKNLALQIEIELMRKLEDVKKAAERRTAVEQEIEKQKEKMEWLKGIINRVELLVN